MKNILYLTFYFEPDLCAGSFRNTPLAYELASQMKEVGKIHVITTLPNRYKSFVTECEQFETHGNVEITRIKLPGHRSGFIDQVNSFRSFYRQANKIAEKQQYDLVFASSSRLFTAYLGYKIASQKKIPLYLDIRDIFTDTLQDVLKNKILKTSLLPLLRRIEHKVFNYASHINMISAGFSEYFKKFNVQQASFFTNGIDDEFVLEPTDSDYDIRIEKPFIITYAGNIGEGQGLHKIIPAMAKMLGRDYHFRIIGDGGAIDKLRDALDAEFIKNVSLEIPVKRKELIEVYKKSHFLFIHLNDYKAFEKVLPSKVFEAGAFPRPVIAGVGGYARLFLIENVPDVLLFTPTNAVEIVNKLKDFEYAYQLRTNFIENFSRKRINGEMAASVMKYLK